MAQAPESQSPEGAGIPGGRHKPRLLANMVDHCVSSDAPALQSVQGCANDPQGYEPHLIFKLVDPAKSVVGKVLVKLTHQIFDSEEWALLQDRPGPFSKSGRRLWKKMLAMHHKVVCAGLAALVIYLLTVAMEASHCW